MVEDSCKPCSIIIEELHGKDSVKYENRLGFKGDYHANLGFGSIRDKICDSENAIFGSSSLKCLSNLDMDSQIEQDIKNLNISNAGRGDTSRRKVNKGHRTSQKEKEKQDHIVGNVLRKLTIEILDTYRSIDNTFRYDERHRPRRLLTKPSKSMYNKGLDNINHDYILRVNDILGSTEGKKFQVIDLLGNGAFGQVVKCRNLKTNEYVAIKIIKNKRVYFNQSMMEVTLLEIINYKLDKDDTHFITRIKDTFIYKHHLCIVLELLSLNLFELLRQNSFRGLSHTLIKTFIKQLLDAMELLNEYKIVHCDLKPENILLKKMTSPEIRVVDFGSACYENNAIYTYIQSRFYRSPEILLGLPYDGMIDMWSIGCIAAELFLGLPLFPGVSNYDQISKIVDAIGYPPDYMIRKGQSSVLYFEESIHGEYTLKSKEKYGRENNVREKPTRNYFKFKGIDDLINNYPLNSNMSKEGVVVETINRSMLADLIKGFLTMDPRQRLSPASAKKHPYLTRRV